MCRSSHTRVYLVAFLNCHKKAIAERTKGLPSRVESRRTGHTFYFCFLGQPTYMYMFSIYERILCAMQMAIGIPFDRRGNNVNPNRSRRSRAHAVIWLTWTKSRPCCVRDSLIIIVWLSLAASTAQQSFPKPNQGKPCGKPTLRIICLLCGCLQFCASFVNVVAVTLSSLFPSSGHVIN